MSNVLYPAPRTYSYNFACDVVEKLFNPNYFVDLADPYKDSPITPKYLNEYVTYFYVGGELVAMYDETSGDLWTTVNPN